MSSNEKVINILVDNKKEWVTTPFSEKKYSTKDVEKGTDKSEDMILTEKKYSTKDVDKFTYEMTDMKQAENTIIRKGLDQFEGQSRGSKGWFKLDIDLFLTFSKGHSEFYKEHFKRILKINTWKCIKP